MSNNLNSVNSTLNSKDQSSFSGSETDRQTRQNQRSPSDFRIENTQQNNGQEQIIRSETRSNGSMEKKSQEKRGPTHENRLNGMQQDQLEPAQNDLSSSKSTDEEQAEDDEIRKPRLLNDEFQAKLKLQTDKKLDLKNKEIRIQKRKLRNIETENENLMKEMGEARAALARQIMRNTQIANQVIELSQYKKIKEVEKQMQNTSNPQQRHNKAIILNKLQNNIRKEGQQVLIKSNGKRYNSTSRMTQRRSLSMEQNSHRVQEAHTRENTMVDTVSVEVQTQNNGNSVFTQTSIDQQNASVQTHQLEKSFKADIQLKQEIDSLKTTIQQQNLTIQNQINTDQDYSKLVQMMQDQLKKAKEINDQRQIVILQQVDDNQRLIYGMEQLQNQYSVLKEENERHKIEKKKKRERDDLRVKKIVMRILDMNQKSDGHIKRINEAMMIQDNYDAYQDNLSSKNLNSLPELHVQSPERTIKKAKHRANSKSELQFNERNQTTLPKLRNHNNSSFGYSSVILPDKSGQNTKSHRVINTIQFENPNYISRSNASNEDLELQQIMSRIRRSK